eukprot:UC1_evm1s1346
MAERRALFNDDPPAGQAATTVELGGRGSSGGQTALPVVATTATTEAEALAADINLVSLVADAERHAPLEAAMEQSMTEDAMKGLRALREEIEKDAWQYKSMGELLGM